MNEEKTIEVIIGVIVAFLIAAILTLAFLWPIPANAENYDRYPDVFEMDRVCNNYGVVAASILADFKKGGDVGVRWVASEGMTPRMRTIMTPVVEELGKRHAELDEAAAKELGRKSCTKYFANWFVKETRW